MKKLIIRKGDKFGKLTAIKFHHRNNHGHQFWLFRCDCGKEKVIYASRVKIGKTKACGCLAGKNIKHGMIKTRTYRIWNGMKNRCLNKNLRNYKDYGGRGIKLCERWMKFENFYVDMGDCPIGKSIDRIDNDGNYEPENCKWSTKKEQANNTRKNHPLTYQGKTQNLEQWTRELNITKGKILARLRAGWSIEKALSSKKYSRWDNYFTNK